MIWQQTFLIVYYLLNVLVTIGTIGKKREPVTPGVAVGATLLWGALIYFVVLSI